MDACCLEVPWDVGTHQVARGKAPDALVAREVSTGEPGCIDVGALVAATTLCCDEQNAQSRQADPCEIPNAQGIMAVRLVDPEPIPVPAGAPTAPRPDGQSLDTKG